MALKSIAQKWFVNCFLVVMAVLTVVAAGLGSFLRSYYYSSAENLLRGHADSLNGFISLYADGTLSGSVQNELQNYVISFAEKDSVELMGIDLSGDVSVTSSGFTYKKYEQMPDYQDALQAEDGIGFYVGEMSDGQKIMALTTVVNVINNRFSAMRFVVSMERVDAMLRNVTLILFAVDAAILLLVLVSGLFFVKSILRPVRAIGKAARQISEGNFKGRILKMSDDEIGELCEMVNSMADELENSEQMKNEFISSVSHELRTPLTAIKGWAETLIGTEIRDADTLKRGMTVIVSETERLSGMVEELLDFSRIQSGRFAMHPEKMDILAELGDAVLTYTEKAKKEGIDLSYNEPEMLPFIYADRNRLRQVFINIIDNAIKYSDPGGSVKVDIFRQGEEIVVSVADAGCGISEEDLPKIKTKFYKANYTRRGSGIGLAVANEIVELHGGTLEVESTLNVGTTVLITLPIRSEEDAAERENEG